MFGKIVAVGFAALVAAVPAIAQQRGTVEFGAFGSNTSFHNSLGMSSSFGAGARIGAFVFPRLSIEFEGGGGRSGRSLGLQSVNQTSIAGRFTAVPLKAGRLSLLLGAGAVHTDYQVDETYGFQGLVGVKLALSDAVVVRVDGMNDWNANPTHTTNRHLQIGLSIYRSPVGLTHTVTRTLAAAPMIQRPDSVSAFETRRLRNVAISYQDLRDSLARPSYPKSVPASSAEALATMKEMIYFQNDKSDLSDSAKTILNEKVTVFRANPAMRIVISGFASQPGTAAYNMALGLRRAEAAKAYLVSQGVEPIRVEIATRGAGQLVVEGPGEAADAANRRGQFRLLIADPYLAAPVR